MDNSNPVRKVFESEPFDGSHRKGRTRQRWVNQVTENITTLGIPKLRPAAVARDVWRRNLAIYNIMRQRPVTSCNGQICK